MTATIPNWLYKRKELTPNRTAVTFRNESITFHQLYEKTIRLSRKLSHIGVKRGERVALLCNNHIDTVILIHALQLLGNPAVMLNIRLTDEELLFQVKDSEAKWLFTQSSFEDTAKKLTNGTQLKLIYKEAAEEYPEASFDPVYEFNLDEICTIMYTSGTTGQPKGVIQSYGNHWWSSIGSALNLGLQDHDAWVAAVPLFHISGFSILVRSVVYGIPVVLYEKFDEMLINDDLINGRATIISVVTPMLRRLVDHLGERAYHPVFRCMLIGGGPVPLSLLEHCKDKQIPVFQTYGMTETSSQIVTLSPEYSIDKLGSAGKPLFLSEVRVISEGKEASPNEIGEIHVKGPNVTKGYLNREEANTKSFTADGWFMTGDAGYKDEDGFLYVVDRRSDLIISGGENIYPAEIENILQAHPAILEAGVVGIDDDTWGQVPCAFYVTRDGWQIDENELYRFCEEHLARFKLPKKWVEIDQLPRNASNKVLRRLLKEQLNKK